MNPNYDQDKARIHLKRLYEGIDDSAGVPFMSRLNMSETKVQTLKYPPSLRLMIQDGGEENEVTVRMQGVLCSKVLPPIMYKPSTRSMSHVRNLRQHVKITALGLAEFDAELDAIKHAVNAFKAHIPTQNVTAVDFLPYKGDPSMEAHARYFTDRNLVPFAKNSPFGPDVDTHGVLRAIQPDAFIHRPDNYVEYCRRCPDGDGRPRHIALNPSLFRIGDIVEIAFSFVGVPIKDGGYRFMLNLRALTLLSTELREDAEKSLKCDEDVAHPMPKRKRLYLQDEETVNATRIKVGPATNERENKETEGGAGPVVGMMIDE